MGISDILSEDMVLAHVEAEASAACLNSCRYMLPKKKI